MQGRSHFEFWLRTGLVREPSMERKFNPWHDPDNGRFTFAGQGRYFGRGGPETSESAGAARASSQASAGPSARQPPERWRIASGSVRIRRTAFALSKPPLCVSNETSRQESRVGGVSKSRETP